MSVKKTWHYALNYCLNKGLPQEQLEYFRNLPKPNEVSDRFFFQELAWCIYNAGMRETVIRKKWESIRLAFFDFDPSFVAQYGDESLKAMREIFNHPKKNESVVQSAHLILKDTPIGKKLGAFSEDEALNYLEGYPFIGKITKYHLARNMGFDVVKPDRHLVRLTQFLGCDSPDKLVSEISQMTGERKGYIDYVLWQWLSWEGKSAYNHLSALELE